MYDLPVSTGIGFRMILSLNAVDGLVLLVSCRQCRLSLIDLV